MSVSANTLSAVARVNGVALHAPGETIAPATLRQRACTELMRQAAQREGLLAADDAPGTDGAFDAVRVLWRIRCAAGLRHGLRQYLRLLAGAAAIEGVDLEGATTPLVQ